METYKFSIEGKVQRVGYRAYVRRYASNHNIKGYVKNLKDGSVEVVANLDDVIFRDFIDILKEGPSYSEVYNVKFEKINYQNFDKFKIKR